MVRAILFILFAGILNTTQAQVTVDVQPAIAYGSANLDVLDTNPKDVKAHATVTNNSTESKTFTWVLTTMSKPEVWAVAVCDVNFCYLAGVDTETFTLDAGQSEILDVHVYPSGSINTLDGAVTGVGMFSITVTEDADATNTTSADYEVTVIDDTVNSLTLAEISKLNVFPNPAVDVFQLEGPVGVEKISMYNLLGRELAQFNVSGSQTFDISQLPRGMYMVALLDEEDKLLKTVRLQKR